MPRVRFGPASTPECRHALFADTGLGVVSQLVPETKGGVKNRMHVDIQVTDLDEGLAAVVGAGGVRLLKYQDPGSNPVYVCADPDGNEFCLVL